MPARRPVYCSVCGKPYSRATTCRNHSAKAHGGQAYPVAEIEYVIARLSGNLPVPYVTDGAPSFGRRKKREHTFFDKFHDYHLQELAKMAAHRAFPEKPLTPKMGGYSTPVASGDIFEDLFGIKAYICNKCFATKPEMIYPRVGEEAGLNRVVQVCTINDPEFPNRLGISKDEYIHEESQNFPSFLRDYVHVWTKGESSLRASQVPGDGYWTQVQIDKRGKRRNLTIKYAKDNSVEMRADELPTWAHRAIKSKQTPLTDQELTEFLNISKDVTFTFLSVKKDDEWSHYLPAIENTKYDANTQAAVLQGTEVSDLEVRTHENSY